MHALKKQLVLLSLPPATYVVFCFAMGVALQSFSFVVPGVAVASLAGCIFYSVYKDRLAPQHIVLLATCFFSLLLGAYTYSLQIARPQQFYDLMHHKQAKLTGTITAIAHEPIPKRQTKITLNVTNIPTHDTNDCLTSLLPLSICLYTGTVKEFSVGDTVSVEGVKIANPPPEDFMRYLAKEQIDATVFLQKEQIQLIKRPTCHGWRWIAQIKQRCTSGLQSKMSALCFCYFASLFVGDKKTNKKAMDGLKQKFRAWGISHYLARSGLHMIIFIAIWQLLLMFLPISIILKELLLIMLVGIYAGLTTPSLSFNRAVLALIIYKCCTIAGKQSHGITVISLVTLLILIQSPACLLFLDFQLSFGLAFLLAWLNQLTNQQKPLQIIK